MKSHFLCARWRFPGQSSFSYGRPATTRFLDAADPCHGRLGGEPRCGDGCEVDECRFVGGLVQSVAGVGAGPGVDEQIWSVVQRDFCAGLWYAQHVARSFCGGGFEYGLCDDVFEKVKE